MKSLKLFSFALLAVVFILGSSCNKYEEGPSVSLLTKKARLVGVWKVEKYVEADGEQSTPSSNDESTWEFKKDGKFIAIAAGGGFSQTTEGTWEFANDKESVKITFTSGSISYSETSKILRLKNKELWIQDEDGDQTHLIPA